MFNKLHICPICYLDYDVKTQMRKKHLIEKNPNYIKQIKGSLNKLNVERADPNVNKYIVRQIKERERKRLIEEAKRLKREKWINGVKIGTRLGALGFIGATGVGVAKHIMLNKRKHVLDSNRIKYIDYQNDFEDMQDQASFMLQNELREEDDYSERARMGRALNTLKNIDEDDPVAKQKVSRVIQDLKQTSVSKRIMDLLIGMKMFF